MMKSKLTERGPIYIGGLAHSGKTPLRKMLGAHPDIAMTRRTYMWNRFYKRYGDLSQPQNLERCLAAMLGQKGIRALKPDPERIRREFYHGDWTYARLFALFHQHHAERLGKRRWGDQLGFVERFADTILDAYPSARMIHMIRDPRDSFSAAMSLSRYRKGKVGWSTARWLHSADLTQRNLLRHPNRYKVVRYETLMARPEKSLQEICDFLQETYSPEMIQAVSLDGVNVMNNGSERTSLGETKASHGENCQRMTQRELVFTQDYARSHMLRFGYPLKSTQLPLVERLLFYLIDWPANLAGMVAWRALKANILVEE